MRALFAQFRRVLQSALGSTQVHGDAVATPAQLTEPFRWRVKAAVPAVFAVLLLALGSAAVITLLHPPTETALSGASASWASAPRSTSPASDAASNDAALGHSATGLSAAEMLIYVVGAVSRPGLYAVPPGSRVIDVVMAAGGMTTRANLCSTNLARAASDGEQIVIPASAGEQHDCAEVGQGAAPAGGGAAAPQAPISLSRASVAELDTLPGIGPALAQRIIDYREQNGGFRSVEELDAVSGIGTKLLANITPLVVP